MYFRPVLFRSRGYGIPEYKMEKQHLNRRLDQMRREGTVFRAGVNVGEEITGDELRDRYDAVVLAMGSTTPRDLPIEGRELAGIHQAMEFLPQSNRASLGEPATSDRSEKIRVAGHRPEERRVGEACVRKCRLWWSAV